MPDKIGFAVGWFAVGWGCCLIVQTLFLAWLRASSKRWARQKGVSL